MQPGDIISLTVIGEAELTGQYAIREDGQIIFPILGATKVIGYTPTQLADQLTELLQPFVVKPIVAVNTISAMPRIVSILGEVARPGVYDLRQCPTLLSLLAVAGNAAPTGDLSEAILVRKTETVKLIPDGATGPKIPRDIPLEAGDAIFIPSKDQKGVFVMGAIKLPGVILLSEAASAGKAVIMAGGPTPDGDASAAYVMRAGKQLPVDLSPFTEATPPTGEVTDMALEAGDVLMIPTKSEAMVYVVGEVKAAGPQPYTKAPTASAAITLAGGLMETAKGREAYLLRRGQKTPIDLQAVLQEGNAESDQALQPGDVLVVPKQIRMFSIVGQVLKPGPQSLDLADTVLGAWALAGGALPEADIHNAVLLRGTEVKRIDIEALVDKGDMQYNLKLEPGDQLVVPRYLDQVYVLGQVLKPGPTPLHKGDTLLDVIARAGGPTAMAAVDAIAVVPRAALVEAAAASGGGGEGTAPKPQPGPPTPASRLKTDIERGAPVRFVDLAKIQAGEDVYLAHHNDLIYIPTLREKRGLDWMQTLISIATSLLLRR